MALKTLSALKGFFCRILFSFVINFREDLINFNPSRKTAVFITEVIKL